jgi:hypothetical protein
LPRDRPLVPLLEAVINSLHALEERRSSDDGFVGGTIEIRVLRDFGEPLECSFLTDVLEKPLVTRSGVVADVIGFTGRNMDSFFFKLDRPL